MAGYDFSRRFISVDELTRYVAVDRAEARRYGKYVKATALTNSEYKSRYNHSDNQKRMRPPPGAGRIFPGYLVVRNLGKSSEYETWIPDHAFEEIYKDAATGEPQ
jgi:hypothetical protein